MSPVAARALLAPALLAAALPAAAQQTVESPVLLDATLLDVVAEGKAARTPDIATIRAGVVTQGASAAAALSDNAARMTRVVAALRRAGVADRDIQTAQINLQPQYRYGENVPPVITGYQASNSVSVRFRDVARSGRILDALVGEGANQIDGPTLSIEAADTAMDEARVDAIRRARARADLYARAAGMTVARILTIAEDGSSPPPVPMARAVRLQAADAASTPVEAGEQEVRATVTVRFLLR